MRASRARRATSRAPGWPTDRATTSSASRPSQRSIGAAPISYAIDGTQYLAVTSGARRDLEGGGRLLVFELGGSAQLPAPEPRDLSIPVQPPLVASAEDLARGDTLYHEVCANCHGGIGRAVTQATATSDLRRMSIASHRAFRAIVLDGMRSALGMRGFAGELSAEDAERIHQYLIFEANKVREAEAGSAAASG